MFNLSSLFVFHAHNFVLLALSSHLQAMAAPDYSIISAFEKACQDLQFAPTRAAAEDTLKRFAAEPNALDLALYIVRTTTSSYARFHATLVLHRAGEKRWASLPPNVRYGSTTLRVELIQLTSSHPEWSRVEKTTVLRAAALYTHRAYLEEPQPKLNEFFELLFKMATSTQPSDDHVVLTIFHFLDLLTEDILNPNIRKYTSGMDIETLTRVRQKFMIPKSHLHQIFNASVHALSNLISSVPPSTTIPPALETKSSDPLSLINRFFTMDSDFYYTDEGLLEYADPLDDSRPEDPGTLEGIEKVVITTFGKQGWESVFQQLQNLLKMCFSITRYHTCTEESSESQAVVNAAHVIVDIAALSGQSYPNQVDGVDPKAVLRDLLSGINEQSWISSKSPSVRLAYADVWKRTCCSHGYVHISSMGMGWFERLARDTCAEIDNTAARMAEMDFDENSSTDVADMLMQDWANLALQADDGTRTNSHPLEIYLAEITVRFTKMWLKSSGEHTAAFIRKGLAESVDEDFGFEDESTDDSRVTTASILTRFVLDKMAPAIADLLVRTAKGVYAWDTNFEAPLYFYQDDLYFLIRFASSILADEGKGESPSLPIQFIPSGTTERECSKGPQHAKTLITALFQVSHMETQLIEARGVSCDQLSPRVGRAILDALCRILRTYLAPSNPHAKELALKTIDSNLRESGRWGCFKKVLEALGKRNFEPEVVEAGANLLLFISKAVTIHPELKNYEEWKTLLEARMDAFYSVPPESITNIVLALTTVARDDVANRLLLPAYNSLPLLAQEMSRSANAADKAIAAISILRGAAQCHPPGAATQHALLQSLTADGKAAKCARDFAGIRPDVGRYLILLANDIICSHLPLLEESLANQLLKNAVSIVRQQCATLLSLLPEISTEELGLDLDEIIALLVEILDGAESSAAEASYYGVSSLFSIVTPEALELPGVTTRLYRLATTLVSNHAAHLPTVPQDLATRILQIVDIQRKSVDSNAENLGLEAIEALAISCVGRRCEGPSAMIVNNALLVFLRSIFLGITTKSILLTNMHSAADALLPLLHVKYDGVSSVIDNLGQSLLAKFASRPHVQPRVFEALQQLGNAASTAGTLFKYGFNEAVSPLEGHSLRVMRSEAKKRFRAAVIDFMEKTSALLP